MHINHFEYHTPKSKSLFMKKLYTLLIGLIFLLGLGISLHGQSITVSGTLFLPQDSIGFTYESPSFDSTDWIGIYHIEDSPGGPPSVTWDYIPEAAGTLYLDAPDDAGMYRAFLLCCDGYDTIAISADFEVAVPVLETSSPIYMQGDSMVFEYVSPKYSDTDWIGLYPLGTKPGGDNPSIDWAYIPDSAGTITFKTDLDPGVYDAYLLCCDGYDSLAATTFQVFPSNAAYITPTSSSFESGVPIEISYNNPDYADTDWIGIYFAGDDPAAVSSVAWSYIDANSGTVSFPGTLSGGEYYAILFCCDGTETIYAESDVFTVEAGASGTYVMTAASVYPEGASSILVNYRNADFQETDWIGIYNKGDAPGGPASVDWMYIEADSGTVEFTTALPTGDYVVYLLCCDGYQIKAKYDFSVADASTPSIISSAITYAYGDSLVFQYNSPDYVDTDWIGIYNPEDTPGDIGSITWFYLPDGNGTMVFQFEDHELEPGEYWAGLFCCDGYDLYARTSFVVTEASTAIRSLNATRKIQIYPNPSSGEVVVRSPEGEGLQSIAVYNLTGQLLHNEPIHQLIHEKVLNLGHLDSGIYLVKTQTEHSLETSLLILE
jgi:hypothetical protein